MSAASAGSFDYVVVGAGSGGSSSPADSWTRARPWPWWRPGARRVEPAIHDPGRWAELPGSTVDWGYETEPQRACAGRRLAWPRGRVLGGTSALNGLAHIRGHRLDYDGWAYHGAHGWGSTTSSRSSSAPRTATAGRASTAVRAGRCR